MIPTDLQTDAESERDDDANEQHASLCYLHHFRMQQQMFMKIKAATD
jgi:hypothetical protein